VHEPGHPDADARGFVSYPAVDTLREMLTLITATRAYEANLSALNAARSMAQRALEIGGNT
jgi:flagellar basal-body rod protein FlgC